MFLFTCMYIVCLKEKAHFTFIKAFIDFMRFKSEQMKTQTAKKELKYITKSNHRRKWF